MGLFSRFRDDGVACGKGCRNLSGEDRKGEVPGADRDENAPSRQAQAVRLARWPAEGPGLAELPSGHRRIIAQEIDRLAQFGDRIGPRFSRLADPKVEQRIRIGLAPVRCPLPAPRTFVSASLVPPGIPPPPP